MKANVLLCDKCQTLATEHIRLTLSHREVDLCAMHLIDVVTLLGLGTTNGHAPTSPTRDGRATKKRLNRTEAWAVRDKVRRLVKGHSVTMKEMLTFAVWNDYGVTKSMAKATHIRRLLDCKALRSVQRGIYRAGRAEQAPGTTRVNV